MIEIPFFTLLMMLKRSSIALLMVPTIHHLRADDAANISFAALMMLLEIRSIAMMTMPKIPRRRSDDDARNIFYHTGEDAQGLTVSR